MSPTINQSEHGYSVRHAVYVRFSTNQSTGIAYVTGCTYTFRPTRARLLRTSRGVRTLFNQSERDYSVRHGVYVRCSSNQSATIAYVTGCTYAVRPIRARLWRTSRGVRTRFNQSERGYSVRHGAYVRCFNQSDRGYGVRHGVYVRFSTNQSTGIAYVTGCTYAFRPIGARCSRILISAAPCGGLRPPLHIPAHPQHPVEACTPLCTSLHTPKNPARKPRTILLITMKSKHS